MIVRDHDERNREEEYNQAQVKFVVKDKDLYVRVKNHLSDESREPFFDLPIISATKVWEYELKEEDIDKGVEFYWSEAESNNYAVEFTGYEEQANIKRFC